jgi:catechol 2,3-dioxygenase-like lactoylglutathione lyase family enzyme
LRKILPNALELIRGFLKAETNSLKATQDDVATIVKLTSEQGVIEMAVSLNHTIIAARNKNASAIFLAEILGLPAPTVLGHFVVVQVGETSLDFRDTDKEITQQHYAFLVSEAEFDEIFDRIHKRGLAYWADPSRRERGKINTWDDGRGCYFDDPSGHLLEIITRPYGSGGTMASNPHPLIAPRLNTTKHEDRLDSESDESALTKAERPNQHGE